MRRSTVTIFDLTVELSAIGPKNDPFAAAATRERLRSAHVYTTRNRSFRACNMRRQSPKMPYQKFFRTECASQFYNAFTYAECMAVPVYGSRPVR
jgi:hypothetical protein